MKESPKIHHVSNLRAGYEFDFGHVTVILGANGSGKSKLLLEITEALAIEKGEGVAVYVEGGRAIRIGKINLKTGRGPRAIPPKLKKSKKPTRTNAENG